jgi:hypothetical protein
MQRRNFLRFVGVGGLVVAAGGTGCSLVSGSSAAAPWHHAGSVYKEPVKRALSYAILSPNPHNRQPWLVDVDEAAGTAVLYCQLDRRLPDTDPFDRQILVGLGAFSELLRLAALQDGYAVSADWFPEGLPAERLDARPIARFSFSASQENPDPLFQQVLKRRSTKEPFHVDQPVSLETLASLKAINAATISASAEPDLVVRLRDLAWQGHQIESLTPRTMQESIDLMRIGRDEIEASPDGIDLGGPLMETLSFVGAISREQLADPASSAFAQGMDMYREIHSATPAYAWLTSAGNSRLDQLHAGRDYVRLNLQATALGVAIHPISQTLQEYPEMADLFTAVHATLGVSKPSRIQMLVRVGYQTFTPASPRWPLGTRLIS